MHFVQQAKVYEHKKGSSPLDALNFSSGASFAALLHTLAEQLWFSRSRASPFQEGSPGRVR